MQQLPRSTPGTQRIQVRRQRSLRVRHLVDQTVGDITTRLARAIGPGPLAHEPGVHLAILEADLYRRQSHAERDLEILGRAYGG